jgi:hypothetical protein
MTCQKQTGAPAEAPVLIMPPGLFFEADEVAVIGAHLFGNAPIRVQLES